MNKEELDKLRKLAKKYPEIDKVKLSANFMVYELDKSIERYKKRIKKYQDKIKDIELKNSILEYNLSNIKDYCEDIESRNIDTTDTDYDLGQDSVARDILKIVRGEE